MDNPSLQINWSRELDGIYYASLSMDEQNWRLGAIRADWAELVGDALGGAAEGVWIQNADLPETNLAAMCCGLGSAWPGMGRGLYERFPAARAAMDNIASLADWDILALLDETVPEKINQSRWQIPYLFMLEYAQWSQLRSLGLKPAVIFGHSLGELIALCFAGVYDARSAWLLLETRSGHMEELEARSDKQGGMLAVPASQAEIDETLAQWPDLRISNRNTSRQFILSGNRSHLMEARRFLRRKRIPAILLNMDLAFHNPAMRILRDISIRRMNGLNMSPAHTTLLSCVTSRPYPETREEICRAIADLDENTVDWVKLIETAQRVYKIGSWLEFGPQETLCGITSELAPGSAFYAADRKGHEAEAMAETCARLFAAGYLGQDAIAQECARRLVRKWPADKTPLLYKPAASRESSNEHDIDEEELAAVLQLISEVSGIKEIRLDMDLRRDLGLRSATLPFVMLEAENRLGRPVRLENLFQITTVLDLALFLTGAAPERKHAEPGVVREEFRLARMPVRRLVWEDGKGVHIPLNPARMKFRDSRIELHIYDSFLKPRFEGSLSALGCQLTPPCREPWRKGESQANGGRAQYVAIFAPAPLWDTGRPQAIDALQALAKRLAASDGLLIVIQRFTTNEAFEPGEWFQAMEALLAGTGARHKLIACICQPLCQQSVAFGDLLNWELLNVEGQTRIIWDNRPSSGREPAFCKSAYAKIWPDQSIPPSGDGTAFSYTCQFSEFSIPGLACHGANSLFTPLRQQDGQFANSPWLPLSQLLEAMRVAATLNNPWLRPAGFTDLRMFRFAAVPTGITRECGIVAKPRVELPLSGAMTRHCRVSVSIAALTATGRKNGLWHKLCESVFLLCGEPPEPAPASRFHGSGAPLDIAPLYKALGLCDQWRGLADLREARWEDGSDGIEGKITLPQGESGFRLYDFALLAAYAALGLRDSPDAMSVAEKLSFWRFYGLGFTRFDFSRLNESCRILLRPSWRSERLARFDAHIISGTGKTILALHNLEFDRLSAAVSQ